MQTYYPYDIDNPQPVTERLVIKDGMIILRHIPKAGTLTIDGFTEVNSPINLQSNQFFCYYAADSLYRESNRLIYFYRGLSGQRVTCHYGAVGTPIIADDMNEIKAHIDKGDIDPAIVAKVNALSAAVDGLREDISDIEIDPELQEDVAALSAVVAALTTDNNDIWQQIDRLHDADDDLILSITDVEIATDLKIFDNISSLSAAVNLSISALSAALYDEQVARINADKNLDARITAIEQKIDDTPADKTVNEIIFSNKPHGGYNSLGKADFLTYVFGADTPAAYSASGASAFITYIF